MEAFRGGVCHEAQGELAGREAVGRESAAGAGCGAVCGVADDPAAGVCGGARAARVLR